MHRFPLLPLILVVVLGGAALAQTDAADRLVDEGRYEEAIAAYEEAIEAHPDDAHAHLMLARARTYLAESVPAESADERERLFALAEAAAERAVDLAPDDPDAHMELARALGRLAQYRGVFNALNLASRTEEALTRAVELDPEHASAWHALALFHVEVPWIAGGRSGLVVPYFERAVEYEPDVITHRVDFAEVLIDRERPDDARAHLDVALSLPARTQADRDALAKAERLQARLE